MNDAKPSKSPGMPLSPKVDNRMLVANLHILYTWDMKLHVPKEPQHVKDWIRTVEGMNGVPSARWENLNVWYGNQLPKYLWEEWKGELKPAGFTWQKFLKLLKHRTDAVLLWYKGAYTWAQFIKETTKLIEGPLGEEIAKRK